MSLSESLSSFSVSTTGSVATRKKMLGTEIRLTVLSHSVFSLHPWRVGKTVARRTWGAGSRL
jgi:hypothetical protein